MAPCLFGEKVDISWRRLAVCEAVGTVNSDEAPRWYCAGYFLEWWVSSPLVLLPSSCIPFELLILLTPFAFHPCHLSLDSICLNLNYAMAFLPRNANPALSIPDYGESHYIGPIKGAQPNSQAWVDGYPHEAWLRLNSYFARAFKEGTYPTITRDEIYLWGRPHPKAAGSADHVGRPKNWELVWDIFYFVCAGWKQRWKPLMNRLMICFGPSCLLLHQLRLSCTRQRRVSTRSASRWGWRRFRALLKRMGGCRQQWLGMGRLWRVVVLLGIGLRAGLGCIISTW